MWILDLGTRYGLVSIRFCLLQVCIIPTYSFTHDQLLPHTFCLWSLFCLCPVNLLIYCLPTVCPSSGLFFPEETFSGVFQWLHALKERREFEQNAFPCPPEIRKILIAPRLKFLHVTYSNKVIYNFIVFMHLKMALSKSFTSTVIQ